MGVWGAEMMDEQNDPLFVPELLCRCGYQLVRHLVLDFKMPLMVVGCANKQCPESGNPRLVELMTIENVTQNNVGLKRGGR